MAIQEIAVQTQIGAIERVLIGGDLSELSELDRLAYYKATCESLGLNPLTKPFDYIELNAPGGGKKLTLYAKRDCTDQLRNNRNVSVEIVSRDVIDSVCVVTAKATMPDGRKDESIGAVPLVREGGEWTTAQGGRRFFKANGELIPLRPDDRANAIMKAETKAKRRVTLSICGLGVLDESEFDTIGELKTSAKAIDTGGHPVGTQAAADHVAETKIADAKKAAAKPTEPEPRFTVGDQEMDVPTALIGIFRALDSLHEQTADVQKSRVKAACALLEKELVTKRGRDGGEYYQRLTEDFHHDHPVISLAEIPALKMLLYKLWCEANQETSRAEARYEKRTGDLLI
jgi:hypothetical protein